ncbi:peptidylprolyl isomerase [Arcticibacterium luteifluviistationis]|uniref:Periplasmic chaperone PpiD n=1 Tax=Arcticibacterium luteifluviistationis TaxID=1784714 RepID=A0A2Z4GDN7_9BACT|nr:SurA N-terminal domain-containing protein [Arcticibacterium luteifluviistationis]AWV99452.1 peptidylprolyl isomerase [Arcticibacterium luteifluviistationis]
MALISRIRENSVLTIGILALALFAFIIGDYFSSGSLGSSGQENVGEINGVDVDYQQFVKLVDVQRQQQELSTGRSATEDDLRNIREQVWEQLVQDNAFQPEYEELGIDVTSDELREMVQGTKNLHPFIRQQFTDPNTGVFNEAQHREFINAAANKTLPAEQQYIWDSFKSNLIQIRKSEKYQNIVSVGDYITTAEAKKEYTTQNNKISAEYLYVPFYSVNDTTVKVSDNEIESYYSKHQKEYNGFDSRSFDYVVYQVLPSGEDSTALLQEINDLARGMAAAENAAAYASANSDVRNPSSWSAGELSAEVKEAVSNSIVGGMVGPIKDGQNYSIYKYMGTERDSVSTLRASHILINTQGADDVTKAAAKVRAQDILSQIKGGASFETLARINGSDGTAQQGGDLGYFSNDGRMIPAFEKAVFGYNGAGLLPNLVETDFGYHIVKVTEAKSNIKYNLAAITKILEPSEITLNDSYQDAESLRAEISSASDMKAKVAANENLVLLTAQRVLPGSKSFNSVQDAREVVLWAYGNDVAVGDVADRVFIVGDTYLIAALTDATDKESPKASDFKSQIEAKVKNKLKGEKIIAKLGDVSGDFEAAAKTYGAGALVESVTDINIATGMLNSAGIDAVAIGKAFGLKVNTPSKPFVGQNGVFVMKKTEENAAPELADYSRYKEDIKQRVGVYGSASAADQAVREAAEIVDRRAKMF